MIRVALIGAGAAARPHILSLEDLRNTVQLAWIHSRTPERLAGVQVPPGTRKTSNLDDILSDRAVDAVFVLTPPNAHLDTVRRAAAAGKHVLLEKPVETSLARAAEVVQVCESAGVRLGVVLQHRMRPASLALRERIASGGLGSLVSASASVRWWRPQSYYDEPGRGTLARDGGGVLMTQAIHTLDLLLHLTGMPVSVTGLAVTSPVHRMETEDTAAALLHYRDGAIGVVDATTAANPGFAERIALNFTDGTATLEGGELLAQLADGRTIQAGERQATGSGANIMAFDHAAHRAVIADFLDAVRTDREPAITGRSALQVQRLIDAVLQSSASGVAVALAPP